MDPQPRPRDLELPLTLHTLPANQVARHDTTYKNKIARGDNKIDRDDNKIDRHDNKIDRDDKMTVPMNLFTELGETVATQTTGITPEQMPTITRTIHFSVIVTIIISAAVHKTWRCVAGAHVPLHVALCRACSVQRVPTS